MADHRPKAQPSSGEATPAGKSWPIARRVNYGFTPSLLDFRPLVLDYLRPMVRLDLRLNAKEIVRLAEAQRPIAEALVGEYFDRVEIGIMKTDGMPRIDQLPHVSRLIAGSWLNGNPYETNSSTPNSMHTAGESWTGLVCTSHWTAREC